MPDLVCEKHATPLEPMGGRSAHISNWYCPVCSSEEFVEAVRDEYPCGPMEHWSDMTVKGLLDHIDILQKRLEEKGSG